MPKKEPQRMCIVCYGKKAKHELLRISRYENEVFIDSCGKYMGRGYYVCRNGNCMERALAKDLLNKHLGFDLSEEKIASLQERWEKTRAENKISSILNFLVLAKRAGKLASGFQAVSLSCKRQKAYLLFIASDVAPNSKKELTALAKQYKLPICEFLTKEQLGLVCRSEIRVCATLEDEQICFGIKKILEE